MSEGTAIKTSGPDGSQLHVSRLWQEIPTICHRKTTVHLLAGYFYTAFSSSGKIISQKKLTNFLVIY